MAKRPRKLTPQEKELWRRVVRDAEPLPGQHPPLIEDPAEDGGLAVSNPDGGSSPVVIPPPPITKPARRKQPAPLPGLHSGESPGVDKRTAQRFKRGKMGIDGRLDLHGLGREAAHEALLRFLHRHAAMGSRCVLVITGKGQRGDGILRRTVPFWLNDGTLRPLILSFSSAQIEHGGDGALYILLKRKRDYPAP